MSIISFSFNRFLSLCLLLMVQLHGSNDILKRADGHFFKGEYDLSITEYKRHLFFHTVDSTITSDVNYRIGECYRENGQFNEALHYYNESLSFTTSDSLFIARSLSKVTLNIAGGNHNLAKQQLLKLSLSSKSPSFTREIDLYLGVNSLYMHEWSHAQESFLHYFSDSPFEYVIDSLFSRIDQLPRKKPRLARNLSSIFPGVGQIYAGDLRNGINPIVINILLIHGLVQAISTQHYLSAGFGGLVLYTRFFPGNKDHAERTAYTYNESLDKKQAREILDRITHEVIRRHEVK